MNLNLSGKNNPNYRNGNRIKGSYPCPSCGRPRICEKRYSHRLCVQCYKANRTKKFDKVLWYKKNRHKAKQFCFDYLGGKCQRCGVDNLPLCCYHFHHINRSEKDFIIGNSFNVKNYKHMEKIKKELNKCMLLCANCHAIIHWENSYKN